MDELLTDAEAAQLGLPAHVPSSRDEIEWGRSEALTLECSSCGAKVTRTLSMPHDVLLKTPAFTCKECNSSNGRRKRAIAAKPAKRRNRPRKNPQTGQEVEQESVLPGALSAGLAGFLPVLNAGLAPAALPA